MLLEHVQANCMLIYFRYAITYANKRHFFLYLTIKETLGEGKFSFFCRNYMECFAYKQLLLIMQHFFNYTKC